MDDVGRKVGDGRQGVEGEVLFPDVLQRGVRRLVNDRAAELTEAGRGRTRRSPRSGPGTEIWRMLQSSRFGRMRRTTAGIMANAPAMRGCLCTAGLSTYVLRSPSVCGKESITSRLRPSCKDQDQEQNVPLTLYLFLCQGRDACLES